MVWKFDRMVSAGSYDSDAFLVPGRSLSYFQLKICQALLSVIFCAYYLLRELARAGVDPLQEDVRWDTRFTQVKTFKWIIGKKNVYVPGHPSKTNAACKSTVGGSIIASLSHVRFTEGKFLMSMSLAATFLQEYTWPNNLAQAQGTKLYHKVMKHHQFMHPAKIQG